MAFVNPYANDILSQEEDKGKEEKKKKDQDSGVDTGPYSNLDYLELDSPSAEKNNEKIRAIEAEIQEKSKYPEIFGKSDSAFAVQTPEAVKGKYMDSFISQGGIFEDKSIELSNAYYNVLNNPNVDQATKNNFKDLTYTAKYDNKSKQTIYTPNLGAVSVGAIVYDATKGIYVQRVQKSDDPRKDFIALDYTTLKPLETGE